MVTASLLITQITRSTTASVSGGSAGRERMGARVSLWGGGGGTGGGPLALGDDDAKGIQEGAAHPLTMRARSTARSRPTRRLTRATPGRRAAGRVRQPRVRWESSPPG